MGSRSIVSVQLVREALTDPRIGEGVAELLALSFASSAGQTEDKRQYDGKGKMHHKGREYDAN